MILEHYLKEVEFHIYQLTARFTHTENITVQELGNMLRAVEGVVTIVQVDHDYNTKKAIMKVKILSNKVPKEAYSDFRKEALRTIPDLKKIEIALNTLNKII
jgi:hypothetical protein